MEKIEKPTTMFMLRIHQDTLNQLQRLYPRQVSRIIRDYTDSLVYQDEDDDNTDLKELQENKEKIKQKISILSKKMINFDKKINKKLMENEQKEVEKLKESKEKLDKLTKMANAIKNSGVLHDD